MKWAFADPPYPGQAKLYRPIDSEAREVNHRILVGYLCANFDAWALSTSAPALRSVLSLCPEGTRVMPWVKPFASFKPGNRIAHAWEPVLVFGARNTTDKNDPEPTVRDWIAANITMRRGMPGAKPRAFCRWLFEVMGVGSGDEFEDLFPGSGAVTAAWNEWCRGPVAAGDLFDRAGGCRVIAALHGWSHA